MKKIFILTSVIIIGLILLSWFWYRSSKDIGLGNFPSEFYKVAIKMCADANSEAHNDPPKRCHVFTTKQSNGISDFHVEFLTN